MRASRLNLALKFNGYFCGEFKFNGADRNFFAPNVGQICGSAVKSARTPKIAKACIRANERLSKFELDRRPS